jgi:hypothetical protein
LLSNSGDITKKFWRPQTSGKGRIADPFRGAATRAEVPVLYLSKNVRIALQPDEVVAFVVQFLPLASRGIQISIYNWGLLSQDPFGRDQLLRRN